MSNDPKPLPTGADSVEGQAADWLQRRHFWTWNAQDQGSLDAWLNEAPAHLVAYLRLEAALNRADRLVALRQPLSTRLVRFASKGWWPILSRVAVGLIIAVGIGIAASQYSASPTSATYSTALGEHKIITLSDGSRIELNTRTELRLVADPAQRMVWLDKGEAYFQIHHDATRPFVVVTGDHRITDLGTKFVVRKNGSRIEVSLVEGRAQVDTTSTWRPTQSAILTPGDVIVATAQSMSLTKKTPSALSDKLGWRRGLLIFRDTSLANAATEFNRYNTHQIVIADQATARLVVGGTFPSDDVTAFVRATQRLFKLHAETRGNETVVSR